MTVIVGITDGSTVWMGADSFSGNSEYTLLKKGSKIWRREVPGGGSMLIGASGDHRSPALLKAMPLPEQEAGWDTADYITGPLVDAMRSAYNRGGYLASNNGREGADQAQLLIGYQGRLFSVWEDFAVGENAHGYMAMGSGLYVALGALAVTEGTQPIRRLEMVLDAAALHSTYVRRPFTIESADRFGLGRLSAVVYDIKSQHLPPGSTGIIDI